jgi:hypothetical protein
MVKNEMAKDFIANEKLRRFNINRKMKYKTIITIKERRSSKGPAISGKLTKFSNGFVIIFLHPKISKPIIKEKHPMAINTRCCSFSTLTKNKC